MPLTVPSSMRFAFPPSARRPRRGLSVALVAAIGLATSGCSFLTGLPNVDRVDVTVNPDSIVAGARALASATTIDNNKPFTSTKLRTAFSSSDPSVATVNAATGEITGVAPGTAVISATTRGKTGSDTIRVLLAPPAVIRVDPPTVYQGRDTPLGVTLLDPQGQTLAPRAVTVTSSNTGVLTASGSTSSNIVLRGVTPGTAIVTLTVNSVTAAFQVNVLPPLVSRVEARLQKGSNTILVNEQAQTSVTLFAADNAIISNTQQGIGYTSDDQTVATVNAASGVVTGVRPGTTNINVLVNGTSARGVFQVTVREVPARIVRIADRGPFLRLATTGTPVQSNRFAIAYDSAGTSLAGRTITYTSTDQTVFVVNSLGIVTPRRIGEARLIASADNGAVADTLSLRVTEIPIAAVTVRPLVSELNVGQTQQLTATLTDSVGNAVSGRTVTWVTSSSQSVTVSQSGLATAIAAPGARITAVVDAVPGLPAVASGSADIVVNLVRVATIDVAPVTVSVPVGRATTISVIPRDANGNQLFNRTVQATVADPSIVSANGAGQILGLKEGTTRITYQALDAASAAQGAPTTITVTVTP